MVIGTQLNTARGQWLRRQQDLTLRSVTYTLSAPPLTVVHRVQSLRNIASLVLGLCTKPLCYISCQLVLFSRLNALDFKDLEDKLCRPVTIAQNIVFHRSRADQFIDVFKEQVYQNPPYHSTEVKILIFQNVNTFK